MKYIFYFVSGTAVLPNGDRKNFSGEIPSPDIITNIEQVRDMENFINTKGSFVPGVRVIIENFILLRTEE